MIGDIKAGPSVGVDVVPNLKEDGLSSVKVRYQGLSESKWCETVKAKREEEQEPTLAALDGMEEGLSRRDAARGYEVKWLRSGKSSKSSEDTVVVIDDSSINALTPYRLI